ncbi:MAG: BREX system P-loop protein BrxC [Mariprofundaceae bacterium]|nr:BREX system P-loop protein BrxC [Mariprofundaceae bacterium]
MKLASIFYKDINRSIEGVIKADDEASLRTEVEEYVLTNEVSKRLESFLDAYNNYEGANGVWISGFFGSGKSHLLKMLSLLLEGHELDGQSALDLFQSKVNDEILRADLKRAASIPSKSILFNIDQKADIISKEQVDALLAVFVKVFDEACGYYGKQGYIAQFERELDQDGLFITFKDKFHIIAGMPWEEGRKRVSRISSSADQAYSDAIGQAATDVLDKYRSDYRVSIEDFAEQVNTYIEQQEKGFRLNFFVDEVGQYIADNVKLMTNLQTIAESLATKCRGRAWVIVTAQEDMNSVVGEMSQQQGNDFSKIQARFANRMKLTSANVDEVIQKRLLLKNDDSVTLLSDIYHEQSDNFGTLFGFTDGSQTYRNFTDRDHFIHAYPFVPYQFTLFQSAIQNLSVHNAFTGKHSSVGERSMLGVFQDVVKRIADNELGELATFDLMFEGIRTSLQSKIQRSILVAEQNLNHPFAVRVLKALFLVKYVKEFKSTARNICVLMQHGFNIDQKALQTKIEEALNLLEQETYIQRNGDIYQFLTETEKDIEQEIKHVEIDNADVENELSKVIFDHIIMDRKIRFDDNKQDYPFSRKLDGRLYGREAELGVHVISPFHEHVGQFDLLKMQSMGQNEVVIALEPNDRLIRDLWLYKQTDKFIKQNNSVNQDPEVKKILPEKGVQNQERYSNIKTLVSRLISEAKLFVNGSELDNIREGSDPRTRVVSAFHQQIRLSYPNLQMLRGVVYSEADIDTYLKSTGTLISDEDQQLNEAEMELLATIKQNKDKGIRTTLKMTIETFERKPYGWYQAAILCTVAKLCARSKIEVRSDSNVLEDNELVRALRNTHIQGNLVLEPQHEFSAVQVRQLKEFYNEFFDSPPISNEAKALGKETAEALQKIQQELEVLAAEKAQYPFLNVLNQPIDLLKTLTNKPYTFYLTELSRSTDDLLDIKEDILDPIREFMCGSMKSIYLEVRRFIQREQFNFSDIDGDEIEQIKTILGDVNCYKGSKIKQAKSLMQVVQQKISEKLHAEKEKAETEITSLRQKLLAMSELDTLSDSQKDKLLEPFIHIQKQMNSQSLIGMVRDDLRRFEQDVYADLLSQAITMAQPEPEKPMPTVSYPEHQPTPIQTAAEPAPVQPKKIEIVNVHHLKVASDKPLLVNSHDVEDYIEKLRATMLEAIDHGKRVQV